MLHAIRALVREYMLEWTLDGDEIIKARFESRNKMLTNHWHRYPLLLSDLLMTFG